MGVSRGSAGCRSAFKRVSARRRSDFVRYSRPWLALAVVLSMLEVTSCSVKRVIAVRACVVEGTPDTQQVAADAGARAAEIWRQAEIGFVTLLDPPVLKDPQPPHAPLDVPPYEAKGKLGDVRVDDQRGYGSDEVESLVHSCTDAWRARGFTGNPQPGFTVVIVRELIGTSGGPLSYGGFSGDLSGTFRTKSTDLCVAPYRIAASDVAGRWTIIETVSNSRAISPETIAVTLAHELGHDLLLGHGDGVDNDANGKWDEYCDDAETNAVPAGLAPAEKPLMSLFVVDGYHLTPLQVDRAGAAADALMQARMGY